MKLFKWRKPDIPPGVPGMVKANDDRQRELKRREREYQKLQRIVDLGNKPPLSIAEKVYFGKMIDPDYPDYYLAPRPASLDFKGMSMHPKVKGEAPPAPGPSPAVQLPPEVRAKAAKVSKKDILAPIVELPPDDEPGEIRPAPGRAGAARGPYKVTPAGVKLRPSQVEALLAATKKQRDRMVIMLMSDLGLGMADIVRIGPSTVNLEKEVFHSGEGDIPIRKVSPRAWHVLKGFVQYGESLNLNYVTFYRIVKKNAEAAGLNITAAQLIRYGKEYRKGRLAPYRRRRPRSPQGTYEETPPGPGGPEAAE